MEIFWEAGKTKPKTSYIQIWRVNYHLLSTFMLFLPTDMSTLRAKPHLLSTFSPALLPHDQYFVRICQVF